MLSPTTLTFTEALRRGYKLNEQQRDEVLSGLFQEYAPDIVKDFAIDLIEKVDIYDKLAEYNDRSSEAEEIKKLYGTSLMFQRRYTYATGYILDFTFDYERHYTLGSLPRSYYNLILKLYNITSLKDLPEKHPLENWIVAISNTHDLIPLVNKLGMIVPSRVPYSDVPIYIKTNILLYKDVFEGLTDYELIDKYNYVGPFINRQDFLERINMEEESFFILSKFEHSKCLNKSSLGIPLDDMEPPYIAFGSRMLYRVYDIDEIIEIYKEFNTYQLSILQSLLPYLPLNRFAKINRLQTLIQQRVSSGMEMSYNIWLLKDTLNKSWFQDMFYLGQYMNGWKGPGWDYPNETGNVVDINLRDKLLEVDLLKSLPCKIYSKNSNSFLVYGPNSLHDHLYRPVSKVLTDSAFYYLGLLGVVIYDFMPN